VRSRLALPRDTVSAYAIVRSGESYDPSPATSEPAFGSTQTSVCSYWISLRPDALAEAALCGLAVGGADGGVGGVGEPVGGGGPYENG